MLSDEALWIRIVCEEILPGRKVAFILDLYHALECASDAVQAVTPDEGKRKKRMDWIREEARHQTGRPSHLQTEAAPPVWSVRGLHPLLRGQQGPNALRPLPEARLAGRIRHRGKCLQAHCREPVQRVGMPLVETGANVVLAIRCCLENMRWPDFLDWRACSKAAA